jgi:3-oxoadipate enol-lactonase/4-carboxymuconolactone decarboxylase
VRVTTVEVGPSSVSVHEWGLSGGTPLVFWHGLNPFGALQLNEAGPAWAKRGFRVLSIAAPGIADSRPFVDLEGYRPSRLARLVVELADALAIERFAYVGWSWGASIGVHLAVHRPERLLALVLLDAGHTDIPGDAGISLEDLLAQARAQPPRYSFPSWGAFLGAARHEHPVWRPALEERLLAGMVEQDGAVVARGDREAVAAAWHGLLKEQPSSAHAALGQLDLPILLVLATRNPTAEETARFRELVPRARLLEIDSRHDLLADAPEETTSLVADWLLDRLA